MPNWEWNCRCPRCRQTCRKLNFCYQQWWDEIYEVTIKNMKNNVVYYKETVECWHLISWPGSQWRVQYHTAKVEPNQPGLHVRNLYLALPTKLLWLIIRLYCGRTEENHKTLVTIICVSDHNVWTIYHKNMKCEWSLLYSYIYLDYFSVVFRLHGSVTVA